MSESGLTGDMPGATVMADKKGRILCVDDEPNIVRALQWLLQKDFEVFTASSGHDAIELVKRHDFDVVISDQRMPVMTGVELLREVKRLSPRSMRILLTGYSDLQAIVRSVNESEVFRFINKPWNISELPGVVEQAVNISRTHPFDAGEHEASDDVATSGESILVIDDNPDTSRRIEEIVGTSVRVRQAGNLADAVSILNNEPVSVIVSETRVGSVDATRLVRLMKGRHPEIVTVMLTTESDAETVTSLINEGQIFRFVPKPIRPGYLKLVIESALVKHKSLTGEPALAARHAVQAPAPGTAEGLMGDVQKVAVQEERKRPGSGFMGSIGASLRRLFDGR